MTAFATIGLTLAALDDLTRGWTAGPWTAEHDALLETAAARSEAVAYTRDGAVGVAYWTGDGWAWIVGGRL